MKRILLVAALLAGSAALGDSVQAAYHPAGVRVSIGAFYRPLAPYGQWIEVEPGVVVWRPIGVRAGWRPYMEGRWIWTDYGWYWVSSEPFGWAVFHYGRWTYDDFYGWVWMPDDVWGPAWVEWRYNDAYIGWAPLPPYASFHIAFGIRFTRTWIAPVHYWSFVDYHRFGTVTRYRDYVEIEHTRRLVGTTRSGAGYEIDRNRVMNRGVDRTFIEGRTGGRIDRAEIRASGNERGERVIQGNDRQNVVETYRPSASDFERAESPRAITRGERRLDLDMNSVERPQRSSQTMELPQREERATPPERNVAPGQRRTEFARPGFTPSTPQQRQRPAVSGERKQRSGTVTTPGRAAPQVGRQSAPSPSRKQPERATSPAPARKQSPSSTPNERSRRRN